uniref:Uncharacterized protein n=1 Tax=Knipowitschia caucasica TaxID=637954 RepID=A0AAV2KVQ4_KNICA
MDGLGAAQSFSPSGCPDFLQLPPPHTCTGPDGVEALCQRLEVRSSDGGRLLFTAEEEEVVMTTEKFTVTGSEGAVFGHSVETPLILAKSSEDLKEAAITSPEGRPPSPALKGGAITSPEGRPPSPALKGGAITSPEGRPPSPALKGGAITSPEGRPPSPALKGGRGRPPSKLAEKNSVLAASSRAAWGMQMRERKGL